MMHGYLATLVCVTGHYTSLLPWLLATNLPTRRATLRAYRRRVWLDELVSDLSGHGFGLEARHLRHFQRLSRLTLAVVLLYELVGEHWRAGHQTWPAALC